MSKNAANSAQADAMAKAKEAASDPTLLAKGINVANQVQNEVKAAVGDEVVAEAENTATQ